jgi:transcription regulator MmyB-like protein
VISRLGETLLQTRLAVALLGDDTGHTGMARSVVYRWFTDPTSRLIYPEEDRPYHGRVFTAALRETLARDGRGSRAQEVVDALLAVSPEFAEVWREHEVGLTHRDIKRILHPELGLLELFCQTLIDPDQSQTLLVYTAVPGSESYQKLQLLSVIGDQRI